MKHIKFKSCYYLIQVTPIITINLDKNQVHRNLTAIREKKKERERDIQGERKSNK